MTELEAKQALNAIYESIKGDPEHFKVMKLKWIIDQIKWRISLIQEGEA